MPRGLAMWLATAEWASGQAENPKRAGPHGSRCFTEPVWMGCMYHSVSQFVRGSPACSGASGRCALPRRLGRKSIFFKAGHVSSHFSGAMQTPQPPTAATNAVAVRADSAVAVTFEAVQTVTRLDQVRCGQLRGHCKAEGDGTSRTACPHAPSPD